MPNIPDTPLTRRALEIATQAHAGQFRRDGKPYISHPVAVAEIAAGLLDAGPAWMHKAPWREWVAVLSYLHDCEEDAKGFDVPELASRLQDEGLINPEEATALIEDLGLLNKNNSASYMQYIVNIKGGPFNRHEAAQIVKRADLTHNLSDLKPGSLRDKYELALYILES